VGWDAEQSRAESGMTRDRRSGMSLQPEAPRPRTPTPPPPPPSRKKAPDAPAIVPTEPPPGATIPISIEDIILVAIAE
jgi:hypothetical protein